MIRIETRTHGAWRIAALVLLGVLMAGAAVASGGGEHSQSDVYRDMAWQTANLALLLGVFVYFGRKPVGEFMATRRSGIETELSEAAALLTAAEQRNSKLQRRLIDLNDEVAGIKTTAGQRAEEETDRILSGARAAAERIRTDARAAIDQELRRARAELQEEAADLALELATQKLKAEVGDSDRDRLVDEFILRVEPSGAEASDSTSGTGGATR